MQDAYRKVGWHFEAIQVITFQGSVTSGVRSCCEFDLARLSHKYWYWFETFRKDKVQFEQDRSRLIQSQKVHLSKQVDLEKRLEYFISNHEMMTKRLQTLQAEESIKSERVMEFNFCVFCLRQELKNELQSCVSSIQNAKKSDEVESKPEETADVPPPVDQDKINELMDELKKISTEMGSWLEEHGNEDDDESDEEEEDDEDEESEEEDDEAEDEEVQPESNEKDENEDGTAKPTEAVSKEESQEPESKEENPADGDNTEKVSTDSDATEETTLAKSAKDSKPKEDKQKEKPIKKPEATKEDTIKDDFVKVTQVLVETNQHLDEWMKRIHNVIERLGVQTQLCNSLAKRCEI